MTETKYKNVFVDGTDVYIMKNGHLHKLCQWIDNVGYYQVVFRIDGKRKYVRVHRLIAETLLDNPNNLLQIDHKDGNKLNNSIDNLEWVSNATNTKRGYDNGAYHSKHRKHGVTAINKATNEATEYDSIRQCAERLGLNRKTITAILKEQKVNNYDYNFLYTECVQTMADECKPVGSEISTESKK